MPPSTSLTSAALPDTQPAPPPDEALLPDPPLASGLFFTIQHLTHPSPSSPPPPSSSPAIASYHAYLHQLHSSSDQDDLSLLPLLAPSLPLSAADHSALQDLLPSLSSPASTTHTASPLSSPATPVVDPTWAPSLALYARVCWHRHWSEGALLSKRLLGYSHALSLLPLGASPSPALPSHPSPLTSLPFDCLLSCLSYLPPPSLYQLLLTHRSLLSLLLTSHVDSLHSSLRRLLVRQSRRWEGVGPRMGDGRRRLLADWLMTVILTLQCGATPQENQAILHLALLLSSLPPAASPSSPSPPASPSPSPSSLRPADPVPPQLAAVCGLLLAANGLCFSPQHAVLTASQCSFLCQEVWPVPHVRAVKMTLGQTLLTSGGEAGAALGVEVLTVLDWVGVLGGVVGALGGFRLALVRDLCLRVEGEERVVLGYRPWVVALALMALVMAAVRGGKGVGEGAGVGVGGKGAAGELSATTQMQAPRGGLEEGVQTAGDDTGVGGGRTGGQWGGDRAEGKGRKTGGGEGEGGLGRPAGAGEAADGGCGGRRGGGGGLHSRAGAALHRRRAGLPRPGACPTCLHS